MFLIDRPAIGPGLRTDLAPRQLFGSAGDLVRAALVARPPAPSPAASSTRGPAAQLAFGFTAPARRRKTG